MNLLPSVPKLSNIWNAGSRRTYGELWLDREPTADEILSDILRRDLTKYSELVFCGYGEPTLRLDDILSVCESIRKKSNIKIRINTNGHANLIYGCDVTPKLKGLIDCVSVSLNTADAESYVKVCHPDHGKAAYEGLLDFAAKAKAHCGRWPAGWWGLGYEV